MLYENPGLLEVPSVFPAIYTTAGLVRLSQFNGLNPARLTRLISGWTSPWLAQKPWQFPKESRTCASAPELPCPLSLHLLTSTPSSRLCLGTIFIGKPFWLFQNPPRLGSSAYAFSLPIPAYKLLASLRAKTTTLDLRMPNSQAHTGGTLVGVWPHSHSLLTQRSSRVSSNKTRNSLCQDTFTETKAYHRLNTCQPFQKCHHALSPMFSIDYTF